MDHHQITVQFTAQYLVSYDRELATVVEFRPYNSLATAESQTLTNYSGLQTRFCQGAKKTSNTAINMQLIMVPETDSLGDFKIYVFEI